MSWRASGTAMYKAILGVAVVAVAGCSDDDSSRRRPPETGIEEAPAAISNQPHVRITFHAGGVANRFLCQLDSGTASGCISPFEADVADGLTVTAVATPTRNNRPSVAFTVTGATTIECQVDAGTFAACSSPFTPAAALADGSHTVTVRGTDAAGNIGTGSTTFTVDTVAPVVAVTAVATPTRNNRPSVAFTVTGATTIECQVDAAAFAACRSPFTPAAALADGSHTVAVQGTDAAGNAGSGATTFIIDTVPPSVTVDDAPPAVWPVNYFDMKFHTTDTSATLACSLNGAAFTACASPFTITTVYNATSTFTVRATDPAGNVSTVSRSWTSRNGLVLHYPWEQGETFNTSLLTQNLAYSPDGSEALDAVGGWAGTAASSPAAHQYPNTIRALSSSADGTYTVSVWARLSGNATGTVLSTMTATTNNGFALSIAGSTVTLQVKDNGVMRTTSAVAHLNQWVQLGVLAGGSPSAPVVQLLIDGAVASALTPQTTNGFGPGQSANLTVGSISGVDLDDLRFYNRGLSPTELCTTLVRGQLVGRDCVPLIPGFELDFEHSQATDTGNRHLPFTGVSEPQFVPTGFGMGIVSSFRRFAISPVSRIASAGCPNTHSRCGTGPSATRMDP